MKMFICLFLFVSVLYGGITETVDQFTGTTTKYTELLRGATLFTKQRDSVVEYGVNLEVSGAIASYEAVGAFVLFENGTLWKRESEPITLTYRDGYKYACYIPLTPEEVVMFSKNKIDKIKLYIFQFDLKEDHSLQFQNEVNMIIGGKASE